MQVRTVGRRVRGAGFIAVALLLAACGGGGGGGSPPAAVTPPPPPPPPTVSLTINPTTIKEGDSVEITWSSTGASSCSAAIVLGIPVAGWDGQLPTSGTRMVGPVERPTEFAINCPSASTPGSAASVIRGVTVTPNPPALSLEITPTILREGQTAQLTWSGNRLTGCEASISWTGPRPTSGSQTVGPFIQDISFTYRLVCTTATGSTAEHTVFVESRLGVNQPPVAHAGPDRSAASAHLVDLQGGFGTDDRRVASVSWTQVGGPAVTLTQPDTTIAGFKAPVVTTPTVLTFSLTVSDDEGLTSAPDTVDITILPIPPIVPLSGDVRFERVPHGFPPGTGLDYAAQQFVALPNVFVEVLDAATQNVIASGTFPADFHFDVPSQTDLRLRATAKTSRQAPSGLPHWDVSVRDLDEDGNPLGDVYSYTGPVFNSGAGSVADGPVQLQIPSGWNATGQLVGPRAAAPFAILDAIGASLHELLTTFPQPDLPPVLVDWSPTNVGGQTFFQPNPGGTSWIVLAGEHDVDTDEYDPAVIRHEFGHFVMNSVSRDDSIGGPHALGDKLDIRVAVSEGFATAFGALAGGNAEYFDSFGPGQANDGYINLDFDFDVNEGWYSESSVHEVLWKTHDLDGIWQVLTGTVRDTDALVSPFALFAAYRQLAHLNPATIDFWLQEEMISGGPTLDAYGTNETNGATPLMLPVYTPLALGGSAQVISSNQLGTGNKLSTHRFLRLNVPTTTNVRFQASAGVGRDPDLQVFHRGELLSPASGPANEDFTLLLQPGDYVLDAYDCGNAECNPDVTPDTVTITVTATAN